MTLIKSIPILVLFSLLLAVGQDVSAQEKKVPAKIAMPPRDQAKYAAVVAATGTPEQKRRQETFLKVWRTINENYFDKTFGGLDWSAVRQEFTPRAAAAKTDGELHELLSEMIGRLNKSHFAIVPPEVYRAIETAKTTARLREKERRAAKGETPATAEDGAAGDDSGWLDGDVDAKYGIGVDLRLMNDQFTITRIIRGSAAEKAKLKTGFIIQKINGISLGELLKSIEVQYSHTRNVRKLFAAEIVTWLLNGAEGTDVGLTYLNEKDEVKEIRIDREKLTGTGVSIGKNFPEQYLDFDVRSIGDDVGYFKFSIFAMPVVERFCAALTEFKNKKAIIIDLRGNHGGLFGAVMGIGGMMSDRKLELGTQLYRSSTENFTVSSKAKNFKGKLIVLVDDESISSAEVLAAALQEGGRALIIGEKTAGQALPAISMPLDTGAVLIYPIANLRTPKGKYLEGTGVTPDIAVALDRRTLLDGRDTQLEAAVKAINENTALPAPAPVVRQTFTITGGLNSPPPPPPPPPMRGPSNQGSGLGPGKVSGSGDSAMLGALPPPPAPRAAPVRDQRSLEIIAEFVKIAGGEEALRKVESYSVKGVGVMRVRASEMDAVIEVYRQKPDRYSELTKTDIIGELRQIYSKDHMLMQTDFGMDTELPFGLNAVGQELLYPILRLGQKDAFVSLEYSGIYDRKGSKAHVISAKTADGENVGLAFDVETKLLVGYTGRFSTYSLGDYEKVGDLMLPFSIDRGNTAITAYEIKVNIPIDESNFKRKINCFDTPN